MLFERAETLAKDNPETLLRVKTAKFPLLYLKLCQGVGYFISHNAPPPLGDYQRTSGAKPPTPEGVAEYIDQYSKLLTEFATIAKSAGIKYIGDYHGDQGVHQYITQSCQTFFWMIQPFAGLSQLSQTHADILKMLKYLETLV